jgi:hypothetical protein
VGSQAAGLFERSKTKQKREPMGFAFSNLRLGREKLETSWRSPFNLMVNRRDQAGWLAIPNTV